MLGLAFGPLILAPLSEFIGRRWLYLVTSSFIMAFAGGSGAAQNFATLLICRFLCGFLGSSAIAVGAGTLADIWGLAKAGGLARLLFIICPFLGPTMGPLAGSYIMHDHGGDWRWTQWIIAIIDAPFWLATLFMRETSGSKIHHSRESSKWFSLRGLAVFSILKAAVFRSLTMLLTEAIAFSITLYTGYAYAMVFSFFASATYVYSLAYGFNSRQIGLSFISVTIGYVLASMMHFMFEKTLYARAAHRSPSGHPPPEHRLYTAMAGSIFLPIGLFWLVNFSFVTH